MTLTIVRDQDTAQRTEPDDVRAAVGGDPDAFERLYRGHVARIHSLARRLLGVEEADDATQEAFIRAWTKLDGFRGDAAFGTWLYRLALNVCLGRRAQLAKDRHRFQAEEKVAERAGPVRSAPEVRIDFERALQRLPDGAREVLVLHDVEGFKHEEIATMLGINSGTSKSQLHRARMLMRAHLV